MRRFDLTPLYKSSIGFDHLANVLDQLTNLDTDTGFPPYNIERLGENTYRISMAVAGFGDSRPLHRREGRHAHGPRRQEGRRQGSPVYPSGHRCAQFRAPFPLGRLCRSILGGARAWPAARRSETRTPGSDEAAHHYDHEGASGSSRHRWRRRGPQAERRVSQHRRSSEGGLEWFRSTNRMPKNHAAHGSTSSP